MLERKNYESNSRYSQKLTLKMPDRAGYQTYHGQNKRNLMFSGCGAVGIEAFSRGSKKAYFVENASEALQCIQENLAFTKFADKAVVLKQDAISALNGIFEKETDIIFMDPPYGRDLEKQVLSVLKGYRYVTEDTLIIVEADLHTDFSYAEELGYELVKEKKYKTNKHVFLKKKEG